MAFRDVAQPENFQERCLLAKRMIEEYEMPMTVLVDSMTDESRAELSELPSPVYVVNEKGIVVAKFPWPDEQQILGALQNL